VGNVLEIRIEPAIEEYEESKSRSFDRWSLSDPAVRSFAGRMVEPMASESKRLPQRRQVLITGILVAIEAEKTGSHEWMGLGIRNLRKDRYQCQDRE